MKKIKNLGSLNLEMALLIALLALAVIFGLTWMGGGIADTFSNAAVTFYSVAVAAAVAVAIQPGLEVH